MAVNGLIREGTTVYCLSGYAVVRLQLLLAEIVCVSIAEKLDKIPVVILS